MDPISIGAGALILFVGTRLGRLQRKPPVVPATTCGCSHNYGAHGDGTRCHAQVKIADQWATDSYGRHVEYHWKWVPCSCQSYDGPEPLPRSWSPSV